MAEIIEDTRVPDVPGCLDPAATNYNPIATSPCNGCCEYTTKKVGCTDTNATNYDPLATSSCNDCCEYNTPPPTSPKEPNLNPGAFNPPPPPPPSKDPNLNPDTNEPPDSARPPIGGLGCLTLNFVKVDGIVLDGDGNHIPETCCTKAFVGDDVFWDVSSINRGGACTLTNFSDEPNGICDLPANVLNDRVVCVDCENFSWWNNLYISLNGASLQETNPLLWDYFVTLIESDDGGSFYVDSLTGEIVDKRICCDKINDSNFVSFVDRGGGSIAACLCQGTPQEPVISCECIKSIGPFVQYASTELGETLLLNNDLLVGGLGLTNEEATFIINNIYSDDGSEVESRSILGNALYTVGGFYMCFETKENGDVIYNKPVPTTEAKCSELKGFWTGTACLCEQQETCDLTITDLKSTLDTDLFGNEIEVITFKGEGISEFCCNKISSENNTGWSYSEGLDGVSRCYKVEPKACPTKLQLNENPIKADCPNTIEISASVYFSKPENPCQPYPNPDDDDGVIIPDDDEPCVLTFDENNNIIESQDTHLIVDRKALESTPDFSPDSTFTFENSKDKSKPCCYNDSLPIRGRLIIETETEETTTPITEFDSVGDGFEQWINITTELIPSETLGDFNVIIEFYQGLNCCCTYDIFVDDLKVSCKVEEVVVEETYDECPGFDIKRVIDNKKSWVYNPGIEGYSDIPEDSITSNIGDVGLQQGHGLVNRDFAPSTDADLPWRYTDYWEQSSVLEKHSNLVLNSKELYLTFNMCNAGKACPDGYTLSGETCVKPICPSGYTHNEGVCYSGGTSGLTATTTYETIKLGVEDCKSDLNLLELESYKKTFQSFWVQFIEQFVPATTIFVSGERWCNRPEDICVEYDVCDFDFEFVEGDVTTRPNEGGWDFEPAPSENSRSFDPETNDPEDSEPILPGDREDTKDGPILKDGGPKILPLDKDLGLNSETPSIIDINDKDLSRTQEYKDELNNKEPLKIIE